MDNSFLNNRRWRLPYVPVLVIILWVAFGLRTLQLGRDSFWNDEAGQALAAIQPTLEQMLAIERHHAMAMPLDYLVSRASSSIGLSEMIMRFPSVAWGMLTLVVCFSLVRRIARTEVALLTVFLLGISPLLVHYSQEMRFYSALFFFYSLSTYLLLKAIDMPSLPKWTAFTLTSALGMYFHPYVLLSVVNGFLYLFLVRCAEGKRKNIRALTTSAVLIAIAFLPGYTYFGAQQQFDYDLLRWNSSLVNIITRGLGWTFFSYSPTLASWGPWGILSLGFGLIGLVATMIQRNTWLVSLSLGLLAQTVLIALGDWVKGYWFGSRQLIHLHPTSLLFTALGVGAIYELIAKLATRAKRHNRSPTSGFVAPALLVVAIVVGALGLSSVQVLRAYYEWPKSTGRDVALALMEYYRPGDAMLVIPGYEKTVYEFYFQMFGAAPGLVEALQPIDWPDLERIVTHDSAEVYLVTPAVLTEGQHRELQNLGFVKLLSPENEWHGGQILFAREQQ